MSRKGITHIKPNEAQGKPKAVNISQAKTGSGFQWGIKHVAGKGVYNVPNAGRNTVLDTKPGVWNAMSKKP